MVKKVKKPWGHEILWARTDVYAGKMLIVRGGHALSLQYHRRKDETMYLLSGRAVLEMEKNGRMIAVQLTRSRSVRIAPGTKHRLIARTTATILEVSTAHLDDVVRLEDRYGRA